MSSLTKLYICILPPSRVQRALTDLQRVCVPAGLRSDSSFHLSIKTQPGLFPDLTWMDQVLEVAAQQPPFTCQLSTLPKMFPEGVVFLPAFSDSLVRLHRALVSAVQPPSELSREYFEGPLYTPHVTLVKQAEPALCEEICKTAQDRLLCQPLTFRVSELSLVGRQAGQNRSTELLRIPLRG